MAVRRHNLLKMADNKMPPYLLDNQTGKIVTIHKDKFSIGRGLNCDYVMSSVRVSRIHCILEKVPHNNRNSWIITNTSLNGTLVNGILVTNKTSNDYDATKTILRNGDIIRLSENTFTFNIDYDCDGGIGTSNQTDNTTATTEASFLNVAEVVEISDIQDDNNNDDSIVVIGNETESPSPPTKRPKVVEMTTSSCFDETEHDDLQCSICSELFVKAVTLTCSHSFCRNCIDEWRKLKSICPICRAIITSINPTIALDNIIESIYEKQSDDVRRTRRELVESRHEINKSTIKHDKDVVNPTSYIEVSSDDGEDSYEYEIDDDDYDENRGRRRRRNRGYGACYRCGNEGHWAPECPFH